MKIKYRNIEGKELEKNEEYEKELSYLIDTIAKHQEELMIKTSCNVDPKYNDILLFARPYENGMVFAYSDHTPDQYGKDASHKLIVKDDEVSFLPFMTRSEFYGNSGRLDPTLGRPLNTTLIDNPKAPSDNKIARILDEKQEKKQRYNYVSAVQRAVFNLEDALETIKGKTR